MFREATIMVAFSNTCGFSLLIFLGKDRYKQKSLDPEESRLFPSVTPTGFDLVTEGHDAERARNSIMPRSAAT